MLTDRQRRMTVSVPKAARVLGVGPSTVYQQITAGDFSCQTLTIGRRIVVP